MVLVALSMVLTSGCRDPDTSQSAGETRPDQSLLTVTEPSLPITQPTAGWLVVQDLDQFAGPLAEEAAKSGIKAALVQPDTSAKQFFLAAAATTAAASQLNGYFYWYLDQDLSGTDQPQLLLVLDRLFSDTTRETALAGRMFTDPAVVSLLTFSLRQLLAEFYQPEILDFILACYRREFSSRQQDLNPSGQIWKQSFNRIEVNYEAAFYNAISFYVLPE